MRLFPIGLLFCLTFSTVAAGQDGKSAELVVGKWEALADQDMVTLEFTKDGKLHLTGNPKSLAFAFKFAKLLNDFKVKPESVPLTYKLPEVGKLEIEADLTKLLEALGGDLKNAKTRQAAKLAVNEKELTITIDGGKSLTFKRIK